MNHFSDFEYQKQRFLKNLDEIDSYDQEFVKKAFNLAEKCHAGQERDGAPFFIHSLRITNNLMGRMHIFNKDLLAAALLHDTVEDTELTIEEIKKQFNQKTAEIVNNLTRNSDGETDDNKYERKYKKHQQTLKKDIETRTIKTLDHLDNVTSWLELPKDHPHKEKIKRWIKEAETIHIPMAKTVNREVTQEINEILKEVKKLNS